MRPIDQAIAAHRSGNLDAAETLYRGVLAANRRDFDALHMLGIVCAQRGNFDEAEKLLRDALSVDGSVVQCLHNYGNVQSRLGRHADAVASYRRALALAADYAPVYSDLGNAHAALGDYAAALVSHDQAVKFMPRSAPAHYNRGIAQFKLGQNDEALKSYNWAVFLDRNHAEAQCNRGDIFREWKQYDEAAAAYDRALSVNPNLAGAWHGRGVILLLLKRYEDAIAAFDKALALKPDLNEVPGMRLLAKMHICDWRDADTEAAHILTAIRSGKQASFPFAMLTIPSSAEDQMRCAVMSNAGLPSFPPLWTGQIYPHDRIRVAYISSDFREHPVAQLAAGLFERHDRSRFEVTAISLRAEDPESGLRRRLKSAFARFVEVQSKSDSEIADLIRQLEIDIAVDLNGLTDGRRPNILARRPAPIQASYLGYAGTMGTPHIDYILADATVIPADQRSFYTEKVVLLPDSFMVTDSGLPIAERTPTRAECGLPEQGFVFCCFNGSYKIAPEVFEIWMRLLKATLGSVLWRNENNPTAVANLRRHAEARGVAGDRIVIAPKVPFPEHLARHRQADLFLDTLPYNAHATAVDALRAGLPVLTCPGAAFAGRVAASLLGAVGLPELVTASLGDYEALALNLTQDPVRLSGLKAKLARQLPACPLFDTSRFTRSIEAAYAAMWRRYQAGEASASFAVEPPGNLTAA